MKISIIPISCEVTNLDQDEAKSSGSSSLLKWGCACGCLLFIVLLLVGGGLAGFLYMNSDKLGLNDSKDTIQYITKIVTDRSLTKSKSGIKGILGGNDSKNDGKNDAGKNTLEGDIGKYVVFESDKEIFGIKRPPNYDKIRRQFNKDFKEYINTTSKRNEKDEPDVKYMISAMMKLRDDFQLTWRDYYYGVQLVEKAATANEDGSLGAGVAMTEWIKEDADFASSLKALGALAKENQKEKNGMESHYFNEPITPADIFFVGRIFFLTKIQDDECKGKEIGSRDIRECILNILSEHTDKLVEKGKDGKLKITKLKGIPPEALLMSVGQDGLFYPTEEDGREWLKVSHAARKNLQKDMKDNKAKYQTIMVLPSIFMTYSLFSMF